MTDIAMRIATAKALGWKFVHFTDEGSGAVQIFNPQGVNMGEYAKHCGEITLWALMSANVPDWPNDLNAMHQAEDNLDESKHEQMAFARHLRDIVENTINRTRDIEFWFWHANAHQRCEAFLRVRELWVENP